MKYINSRFSPIISGGQDSTVGIVTAKAIKGSNSGEDGIFLVLQISSEAHLASCTICTRFLSGGKWLEHGADCPHPSSAGFKLVGAIPLPPLCACQGETFTFIFMSDMTVFIAEHATLLLGIIH